jgi:hypothetical protein
MLFLTNVCISVFDALQWVVNMTSSHSLLVNGSTVVCLS